MILWDMPSHAVMHSRWVLAGYLLDFVVVFGFPLVNLHIRYAALDVWRLLAGPGLAHGCGWMWVITPLSWGYRVRLPIGTTHACGAGPVASRTGEQVCMQDQGLPCWAAVAGCAHRPATPRSTAGGTRTGRALALLQFDASAPGARLAVNSCKMYGRHPDIRYGISSIYIEGTRWPS